MGKSKDLATGEIRFVNTSGDTMTGALTVSGSNGELLNVSSTTGSELAVYVNGNEISFRADADNNNNDSVMTFDLDGSEKMRINTSGHVTKPNQPHMLAQGFKERYGTTDRALFHTVTTNTGNHWNNTNGKFTCPVGGTYLVTAFSGYTEAQNYIGMGIGYNGSLLSYGWMHSVLNLHAQSSVTVMKNANANDYFYYYLNYGYTTPVDATGHEHHSHLSVYLLG